MRRAVYGVCFTRYNQGITARIICICELPKSSVAAAIMILTQQKGCSGCRVNVAPAPFPGMRFSISSIYLCARRRGQDVPSSHAKRTADIFFWCWRSVDL